MKRALFIGRFQPFHLGHLDAIHQILPKTDHLLIAIGSAESNFIPENPFTAGERYQMIEAALTAEKIPRSRYAIIPIRNIENYGLWVRHVEMLLPPFEKVYSGSSIVQMLFRKYNKHAVEIIEKKKNINATEVREAMKRKKNWEQYLPEEVTKFIKSINGIERIQAIHTKT
ncbi:nicotinamide-nucleotide adenylyltransferase [Candidatus Peregrinibacteria bacterium]|nr:nicotinamide-nucleotide adenylyltransferase [Candidatus Peregrinibacteria bacterium]